MLQKGIDICKQMAAALSVCCLWLLCSCSNESTQEEPLTPEDYLEQQGSEVEFNFTLEVPIIDPSRTPSGYYNDGRLAAYENYIDPARCQFLIFEAETSGPGSSGNTKMVCMLENIQVIPRETNAINSAKRYTVRGTVETERISDGNYKMMVIANWPKHFVESEPANDTEVKLTAGTSTIDDVLSQSIYNFSTSWRIDTDNIPMYGILDCTDVIFRDKVMSWIDKIHLIRAMSKIEVVESTASQIDHVTLRNYNQYGYGSPGNAYSESDYVKGSYTADYVDDVNIPLHSIIQGDINLNSYVDTGGLTHFYIYVPEYKNIGQGELTSYLKVYFAGESAPVRLDFKYYKEAVAIQFGKTVNDPFDIQRNYYYSYSITKIAHDLDIKATVHPYYVVDLNPGFGLDGEEPREEGDYKYETSDPSGSDPGNPTGNEPGDPSIEVPGSNP